MKNLIGGLFETQEQANQAYEALETSGFAGEDISMFVHKPRNKTARAMEISVQDVARTAIRGRADSRDHRRFDRLFCRHRGNFPALFGTELGSQRPTFSWHVHFVGTPHRWVDRNHPGRGLRLLRSQEKAEVMTRQIEKSGVLVTVHVRDPQHETRARRVMEEHNAIEVGKPHENWDLNVWVSPNEKSPSLANTR